MQQDGVAVAKALSWHIRGETEKNQDLLTGIWTDNDCEIEGMKKPSLIILRINKFYDLHLALQYNHRT
jgi:hypothetical protein